MNAQGEFLVDLSVSIKNTSTNSWGDLLFYFIPNVFTEESVDILYKLNNPLYSSGIVQLNDVNLEGEPVEYSLNKDTLKVPLKNKLDPNGEINVRFSYEMTLPERGLRFTKSRGNFHLAQFYPMVATYKDNKWNKEEFSYRGESYHTTFSDFTVTYDLPEGYTIISTSEEDKFPSEKQGTFSVQNVKEIYLAIVKNPIVIEKLQDDVNIRVFGFEEKEELYSEISKIAADSLKYFENIIGPYPFSQLDIVLDSLAMEYPGIVSAHTIYGSVPLSNNALKNTIVHEIAHQWFYGVVSNDPYNDAWLDEGFADFATGLYTFSKSGEDIPYESMYQRIENLDSLPVNLPLDEYIDNSSSYIYGKSSVMLWKLFEKRGGLPEAEKYLKTYYNYYNYKEIDSEEFVRFSKYYFNLKDDSIFKNWLLLE